MRIRSTVALTAAAVMAAGGLVLAGSGAASADTVGYTPDRTLADDEFAPSLALEIADDGTVYALRHGGWRIDVFGPRADGKKAKPVRKLRYPTTEAATDIALDGGGRLYILDPHGPTTGTSKVTVLRPGGKGAALRTLVVPGEWTRLGVSVAGHVAVAGESAVRVYAPGAAGSATPSQVLAGAGAHLPVEARDVAFTSDGRLWVADEARLLVYARGATGATAPAAMVAGSRTGLSWIDNLDVDSKNRVYVGDEHVDAIKAFSSTSYGNVAPIRTLSYDSAYPVSWALLAVNARGDMVTKRTETTVGIYRTLFPRRPSVVRSVRVSGKAGAKKRTVRWKKPADDGGRAVRSYRVVIRKGSKVLKKVTLKPGRRSYTVKRSSLRRGKLTVTVRAKTAKGWSPKATKKFRVR
ncbi:hypothetical protein, partial [Mumia quercus]|uniref:hypothetical protein n=1 Tax=Mumia quercus TaxID=2976125 RepID=UPI0021D0DCC3